MRVEGRFVGAFAKDARELVTRCRISMPLVVNLSEVTFVDAVGEEVLSWLARIGGGVRCRELLSPPRLRTPAFADGAQTRRGSAWGNVTAFADVIRFWRCSAATRACEGPCEAKENNP
jgi:hypothetical protein